MADEREHKSHSVSLVTPEDLPDLLALMRSYCNFYGASPTDESLLTLSRTLLDDQDLEGVQLIARDEQGAALGFATVYWTWDTTEASRIGIMHDLYVSPEARGSGTAEQLIATCVERCQQRGASRLEWQTGPDNRRAQAVYDRVGGTREPWLVYSKATPPR